MNLKIKLARLHADWRTIARHSWSMRCMAGAALCSGVEVAAPIIQPYVAINPIYLGVAAGICAAAGMILRLIAQNKLSGERQWRLKRAKK